jgi:hypothetical protein
MAFQSGKTTTRPAAATGKKRHGGTSGGGAPTVNATGNAPNTGAPGPTPAPTRPLAPDLISRIRDPQEGARYGQNSGAENPSSIDPGQQLLSPLAANLKSSVHDDAIDRVIAEGTARQDDFITGQLRAISDKNVPNHPAMKSPNRAGGTYDFDSLPAKLGTSAEADPKESA